jgi:hypothetical protein
MWAEKDRIPAKVPAFFKKLLPGKKYAVFYLVIPVTWILYVLFPSHKNTAIVKVVLKAEKNDTFQLFYRPVELPDFTESNSETRIVTGSPAYQTLLFEIPAELDISNVRFDLGVNRAQGVVHLDEIVLNYENNTLLLFKAGVFNKFACNEFVERDEGRFILTPIANLRYDPYLSSGEIVLEYKDLTYNKKKLPALLLVPLVAALLGYLLFFSGHAGFLSWFYSAASVFFIAILMLPLLNSVFYLYKDQNSEKRILAENPGLPGKNIAEYPRRFENYFNDNFGFRSLLVKLGGKIKYYFFNTSSVPLASVGKESWMYLNAPFYPSTTDKNRGGLFADTTLHRMVKIWEDRKHVVEKNGIKFYKAFWPDKHTVYPEYLPAHMSMLLRPGESRLDQIENYLKEKKSDLRILDVTPVFMQEKKNHLLYLKHDSHWNSRGAFIAYTQLMNEVSKDFPELKPFPASSFEITDHEIKGGEISDMIGLKDSETTPVYKLKAGPGKVKELPYFGYPPNTLIYENKSASTRLTLLIFRDSFTIALVPFLNLHFKKVVLIWLEPFTEGLIQLAKPDLVIESNVSRYMTRSAGGS